jgi:hypothetical protein
MVTYLEEINTKLIEVNLQLREETDDEGTFYFLYCGEDVVADAFDDILSAVVWATTQWKED